MEKGAVGSGVVWWRFASLGACALGVLAVSSQSLSARPRTSGPQTQIPTTLEDFFEPGTQEGTLNEPIYPSPFCRVCHSYIDDGNRREVIPPYDNWVTSMMGQAARDPVWHAALAIANQDANLGGDLCIRCHSPGAWLGGRSVPTDASAFTEDDYDGVNCNFCHRLVNPVAGPNNPTVDGPILKALQMQGLLPTGPGGARYIVDPDDARRGPLPFCDGDGTCGPNAVPANYHGVPIYQSPFHLQASLCGTCHDVSNPAFTRQANGTYVLNPVNAAHPTGNQMDMMPEQRTYSEWQNSRFAANGVYFADQRFGGPAHPTHVMQSCQDCHMPLDYGGLCIFWSKDPFFLRPDIPIHSFSGSNTWVIGAVLDQYGQGSSGLNDENVALAQTRVTNMLQTASDMQLAQSADKLKVRVINYSGHKLPTGYPEGRRMWLNVKFYDSNSQLVAERGAYNFGDATLATSDTKVYEMRLGMDNAVAAATNLPAGESFHLLLNNVVIKDNRIPPIGFTNAAFNAILSPVVGTTYADNQYWDDTLYTIPAGATQAIVTLYYQTTSKEYIEFLRDKNTTNSAGQNAYDRWVARGMSIPIEMDSMLIALQPAHIGDTNSDGVVNMDDLLEVIRGWGSCPPPNICTADVTNDGQVNIDDLLAVIMHWG